MFWSPARDFGLVVRALPLPASVTQWLNANQVIVGIMLIYSATSASTSASTPTIIPSAIINIPSQVNLHSVIETSSQPDDSLLFRLRSVTHTLKSQHSHS